MQFGSPRIATAALLTALLQSGPAVAASGVYLSLDVDNPIIEPGQEIRVSWATSGAESCVSSGAWWGEKPVNGARRFYPDSPSTYTLTCKGPQGTVSETVAVSMADEQPKYQPPVVELRAINETIQPGEYAVLNWTSEGATACSASGDWRGDKPLAGWRKFQISQSASYSISCTGPGGSTSQAVTVNVGQPPTVDIMARSEQINSGDYAVLHWVSEDATSCTASGGDWRGDKPLEGWRQYQLTSSASYSITCSGPSGTTTDTVQIAVVEPEPEPQPEPEPVVEPTVKLAAASRTVDRGGKTELRWSSTDADGCSAEGAWQGSKSPSGSQTVGPLDRSATFSLTCAGKGGNAMAMISVSVKDAIDLVWQAPTRNVDGTPIGGLAKYRVHYGVRSGSYTETVELSADQKSHTLMLPSGSYYFALTAVDSLGNESNYSNEVVRTVL